MQLHGPPEQSISHSNLHFRTSAFVELTDTAKSIANTIALIMVEFKIFMCFLSNLRQKIAGTGAQQPHTGYYVNQSARTD